MNLPIQLAYENITIKSTQLETNTTLIVDLNIECKTKTSDVFSQANKFVDVVM